MDFARAGEYLVDHILLAIPVSPLEITKRGQPVDSNEGLGKLPQTAASLDSLTRST